MMRENNTSKIRMEGESRAFREGEGVPLISVLLPTFRRPDILERTLSALEKQSLSHNLYEVIIVDDGSGDTTEDILIQFTETTEIRLSFVALQENGGPARARNVGLGYCRSEIVLIVGDDIEADTRLVEKHLQFHTENIGEDVAVLGHVTFPGELQINEFMRWLEDGGRKYFFNYRDLQAEQQAGYLFFYTCNVSVKMSLLNKSGWFDESFPYASHEDLELGYRLTLCGMKLYYRPDALGYHWHMLSVQGIARRIYLMGYSAILFWQKVGESGGPVRRVLRNVFSLLATTPPMVRLWERLQQKQYKDRTSYPLSWNILLFLSFFIGISDSGQGKPARM